MSWTGVLVDNVVGYGGGNVSVGGGIDIPRKGTTMRRFGCRIGGGMIVRIDLIHPPRRGDDAMISRERIGQDASIVALCLIGGFVAGH